MSQYTKSIFMLLFQRLTSSKTTKFVKSLLVFFSVFIVKYGANKLIDMVDSLEPKLMAKVLDRLFIAEVQKVSGTIERKLCAVGIIKLLCEAPAMTTGEYSQYWCVKARLFL